MSRLTKKDYKEWVYEVGTTINQKASEHLNYINHKLGKLEDIEDDLGCPLDVVFKALTFGFVNSLKEKFSTKEYNITLWKTDFGWVLYIVGLGCHRLIEYKKTWWLKEDLSE